MELNWRWTFLCVACSLSLYSGDLGNGSVSWVDVASVVVACIEATAPPTFPLKCTTRRTNMLLRKAWRNSTAWSLMNIETMIPKLLECFWGESLFASQDGESGSGSCIAKGRANQQRWKPSTWLTIEVRNELSPGSYIHSFFCQIVWLSWIVCPVPYIKPGWIKDY